MSIPNFMAQELPIPAMADRLKNKSEFHGYAYKISKFDLDDLVDVSTMESIVTRGMISDEIVIVAKSQFTFMSQCFVVVEFMEKVPE